MNDFPRTAARLQTQSKPSHMSVKMQTFWLRAQSYITRPENAFTSMPLEEPTHFWRLLSISGTETLFEPQFITVITKYHVRFVRFLITRTHHLKSPDGLRSIMSDFNATALVPSVQRLLIIHSVCKRPPCVLPSLICIAYFRLGTFFDSPWVLFQILTISLHLTGEQSNCC